MNRLLRLLTLGGLLATSSLTSLTACAEATPAPKSAASAATGAAAPTTSQAIPQDTTSPSDAAPATTEASAEPPNPSEYDVAADTDPAALSDFRDTLEPYGTWEDDSTYGTVWVPASTVVGAEFTPYVTHGHWGLTATNSWIWVSDFNWGWAPFHYGRWVWIGGRGWAWIPGRVYSPAWVVWRTGYYDDWYVGWAPMPPVWYWRSGFAVSLWYVPPAPYVFCSSRYVFHPRMRGYIVPTDRVGAIAPRTRPYIAATAGVASSSYRLPTAARGPTMADAHVPAEAVPSTRAAHDARAMTFAQSTARPMQSRTFSGTQPGSVQASSLARPSPAASPRTFSRPVLPPTSTPQVAEVPRPMSPTTPTAPRTFSNSPGPLPAVEPRSSFTPPPAPVAPRPFSPPTAAPPPVAPRPFSPAPVAPRSSPPSFSPPSPAPVAPRSFSPAPVAPRSFSPPPAPPRSFSPPAVRSNPSPAPAAGRSFGGRR
jgi:hypothetical protein